jgi:hypothetical protein
LAVVLWVQKQLQHGKQVKMLLHILRGEHVLAVQYCCTVLLLLLLLSGQAAPAAAAAAVEGSCYKPQTPSCNRCLRRTVYEAPAEHCCCRKVPAD